MAIVFVSASDVSALTLEKIQTTHWDTKVVSKRYSEATGEYYSSGVGQGTTDIQNTDVFLSIALFSDEFIGMYGKILIELYNFTFNETTDKLKSIDCKIEHYLSNDSLFYSYIGACNAKITFTTRKTFEGTTTFTDAGIKYVITLKGKKLGRYIGD